LPAQSPKGDELPHNQARSVRNFLNENTWDKNDEIENQDANG